jgi:organic radical activating enzyme
MSTEESSSIDTTIILPIHETFQETVQGEGARVGTPSDFIRLYGCPVRCPWCDTGYDDGGKSIEFKRRTLAQLLGELRSPHVVITGGEPFIHQQLPLLCNALLADQRSVAIETSGAFWTNIPHEVWITLSPKEHISKQYPVHPQLWKRANEIKLVIESNADFNFYGNYLSKLNDPLIFLQPEWNSRKNSIPIVLELLRKHPYYRLSLQTHKYINVP